MVRAWRQPPPFEHCTGGFAGSSCRFTERHRSVSLSRVGTRSCSYCLPSSMTHTMRATAACSPHCTPWHGAASLCLPHAPYTAPCATCLLCAMHFHGAGGALCLNKAGDIFPRNVLQTRHACAALRTSAGAAARCAHTFLAYTRRAIHAYLLNFLISLRGINAAAWTRIPNLPKTNISTGGGKARISC